MSKKDDDTTPLEKLIGAAIVLVIVFFVILAWTSYQGYEKGFLRITLSLVSWILVIIVANALAPQLAQFIISETRIDEMIMQSINEKVTITNTLFEHSYPYTSTKKIQDAKVILDLMPIGQPMRCAQLSYYTRFKFSCQKVTAMLKMLINAGFVKREEMPTGRNMTAYREKDEVIKVPTFEVYFIRLK